MFGSLSLIGSPGTSKPEGVQWLCDRQAHVKEAGFSIEKPRRSGAFP